MKPIVSVVFWVDAYRRSHLWTQAKQQLHLLQEERQQQLQAAKSCKNHQTSIPSQQDCCGCMVCISQPKMLKDDFLTHWNNVQGPKFGAIFGWEKPHGGLKEGSRLVHRQWLNPRQQVMQRLGWQKVIFWRKIPCFWGSSGGWMLLMIRVWILDASWASRIPQL